MRERAENLGITETLEYSGLRPIFVLAGFPKTFLHLKNIRKKKSVLTVRSVVQFLQ